MKKKLIRIVSLVLMLTLLATSNAGLFLNVNAASYTYSNFKDLPKAVLDRFIYLMEKNGSMDVVKHNGYYCVGFKYNGNTYYIKESAFNKSSASYNFRKYNTSMSDELFYGWDENDSTYIIKMWKSGDVCINIMRVDHEVSISSTSTRTLKVKGTATAALTITYDTVNMKLKLTSGSKSGMLVTPTYTVKTSNRAKIGVTSGNGYSATGCASRALTRKGDSYTFTVYTDKALSKTLRTYLSVSVSVRATY